MDILLIFIVLSVKHFICDFPLQANPWMYRNKGTYGHPGGLAHSIVHVIGTIVVLPVAGVAIKASLFTYLLVLLGEFLVHYHVDWAKVNITSYYNWTPTTSEKYWILLGFDQLLHQLTYCWMIWVLFI